MVVSDVGCVGGFGPMSEGVASIIRRNAFRFALTGIVGVLLSGCADATRFADAGNPFSNPFASASGGGTAPTPQIASTPLSAAKPYNGSYAAAARPSPAAVASSSMPAPEATGAIRQNVQPVGGSAAGWTAVGGSPIVVGAGDDAASLSSRYGVPEAALLSANGLRSRSDLRPNMRIVIPVYNARVAKAEAPRDQLRHPDKREKNSAEAERSKRADAKKRKGEDKRDAEAEDGRRKLAKGEKPGKGEKSAKAEKPEKSAKAEKPAKPEPEVAKNEPAANPKKPQTDKTPTGNLASAPPSTDESGQLRWPARGRIIQGFKQNGNDGINIALPEGTSVRAAEDGKVAYAGNALKGYGNLVLIRHANGLVTAYANNGELEVKSGETVKRGQVIAKSGETGDVSTPQLHFEVRKGQTPVDPTKFLAGL
jgi:murein DD-endopeptidase MepM/ murein hydrolase activator NlpD